MRLLRAITDPSAYKYLHLVSYQLTRGVNTNPLRMLETYGYKLSVAKVSSISWAYTEISLREEGQIQGIFMGGG